MDIVIYAFSMMYTPGPVNVMGFNEGLTGQFRRTVGFFVGVGCAMLMLFLIFGYTGEAIISKKMLPCLAFIGGGYTLYLAYKVFTSTVTLPKEGEAAVSAGDRKLTFWNGFMIQALNPKAVMVVLPITSVMFPASHVTGASIAVASTLIAIGAAGAPCTYAFLGAMLGRRITHASYFTLFNRCMGLALLMCAGFMFYDAYLYAQV